MAKANFEKLRVYELAETLADAVWELVRPWDSFSRDTVGKQLVRAADSIGANIAEGSGRGTYRDNRQFVRTARGSLYETKHFLRRAYRRKLVTSTQIKLLKSALDELGPKLNAYLRYLNDSVTGSTNRRSVPEDN
ncbi:MAG TPA: four helix bundle protein [Tepidisphaeraceae bacterium]|nr:four helix bundle protein [Tepidisphaeraceae bacterium]